MIIFKDSFGFAFGCCCGTEHQVKLIMVCWESRHQTVLSLVLITGSQFPQSPSSEGELPVNSKVFFYFSAI